MPVERANYISDNQGSSFTTVKNPVAFQGGKIKFDLSAPDYKIRARLDTLIKSGALKVDGDRGQFISDVLEGVRDAREHGDTSVSLDEVALADFTQNDAVCAKRLGGNRPAEVDPFKNTVDKEAYALINKPTDAEAAKEEIANLIGPLRDLI
jgi:hypothetical protein